jgi:hypothetical protein
MKTIAWAFALGILGFGAMGANGADDMKTFSLANKIAALAESGGQIDLGAGIYLIDSPATIEKPNVTIAGQGKATRIVVAGAGAMGDLLNVKADGFTLRNCLIEWSPSKGESALIACENSDVRIEGCSFEVKSELQGAEYASVLSIAGPQEHGVSGLWVVNNQFSLGPWTRALRIHRLRDVFVSGNQFNGQQCEPAQGIYTSSCNFQQFTGNTFLSYGQHHGPNGSVGLLIDNPGGDASHAEVTGNHFHTFFGTKSRALKANQAYFTTITGNVFGRVQGMGNVAVEIANSYGVTISGNQIENINSGGEAPAFLVNGGAGIAVSSNGFSGNYVTEMEIVLAGHSGAISVSSNSFYGRAHPHDYAIKVSGNVPGAVALLNNSMTGYVEDNPIFVEFKDTAAASCNAALQPTDKQVAEEKEQERLKKEAEEKAKRLGEK